MKKYYVSVKEVWSQLVEVEAENEAKAIEKVENQEGNVLEENGGFEYDYTLKKVNWTIGEDTEDIFIPHEKASKYLN